jgi:hypothetical protein
MTRARLRSGFSTIASLSVGTAFPFFSCENTKFILKFQKANPAKTHLHPQYSIFFPHRLTSMIETSTKPTMNISKFTPRSAASTTITQTPAAHENC